VSLIGLTRSAARFRRGARPPGANTSEQILVPVGTATTTVAIPALQHSRTLRNGTDTNDHTVLTCPDSPDG